MFEFLCLQSRAWQPVRPAVPAAAGRDSGKTEILNETEENAGNGGSVRDGESDAGEPIH